MSDSASYTQVTGKLINRQDAIVSVASAIWHYPNELYTSLNCFDNCQELAERALNCLPSAEPERKKGKWIPHEGGKFVGFPYMHYECSECRAFEPTETNFCPHCGSYNGGEQE